jgi:hypothetical protein
MNSLLLYLTNHPLTWTIIVWAAKSHSMLTMLRSENKRAETLIRYLDRGAKFVYCTLRQIIQQGFQFYRSIPL